MTFEYLSEFLTCRSDWHSLGYFDWPNRQQPDLKYPTNPMFEYDRFWGTDAEYTDIEPAIHLASAFLSSPPSIQFIYSLVYECKRLPNQFDFVGWSCYQFRRTTETDTKLIQSRIDQIFEETAFCCIWGPQEIPINEAGNCTPSNPLDKCPYFVREAPDLKGTGRLGRGSNIRIAMLFWKRIAWLRKTNNAFGPEMLTLNFELAILLCHEAVHAIGHACDWQARLRIMAACKRIQPHQRFIKHEPFFEDQTIAELGIAWETEVLGSHLSMISQPIDQKGYVSLVQDWPDRQNTCNQNLRRCVNPWKPPCTHMSPLLSLGAYECPSTIDNYVVSMYYIDKISRASFWRSVEANRDFAVNLRIPRTVGFADHSESSGELKLWGLIYFPSDRALLWRLVDRVLGWDVRLHWRSRLVYEKPARRMICNTAHEDTKVQARPSKADQGQFAEFFELGALFRIISGAELVYNTNTALQLFAELPFPQISFPVFLEEVTSDFTKRLLSELPFPTEEPTVEVSSLSRAHEELLEEYLLDQLRGGKLQLDC